VENIMSINHQFCRKFSVSEGGAIAPLFGLSMLVMIFLMGISIDGARGTRVSTMAGNALDAAALAAAKSLRLSNPTDAELTQIVQQYFRANFPDVAKDASIENILVVVDRTINKVKLIADLKMPTTIAAVMGENYLDVRVSSTAVFDVKDLEVSMMLDVSGSMGGSKITDLKSAAKDLVDILLPAGEENSLSRISISPFSTSVNAGVLVDLITIEPPPTKGKKKVVSYADTACVTERSGAMAFTDASGGDYPLGQKASFCPSQAVLPLTNNVDAIKAAIDGMQANGMTAGHLGIAWAWYMLSPEWDDVLPSDSEPVGYDDDGFQKVAILMTDGMFNSYYESGNGSAVDQARSLCDSMKAKGISIYTIGFQVPADVVPTLKYCATSPKHYFNATDGAELRETFKTIANRLNGLRISS
jgi:Flp pilus assembly protein TadG